MLNLKVVTLSIIATVCLVLTFTVDWLFIIPAVLIVWLNQRELMRSKDKKLKIKR